MLEVELIDKFWQLSGNFFEIFFNAVRQGNFPQFDLSKKSATQVCYTATDGGATTRACHLKMAGDRKIDHAELVRRSMDDRLPNLN